MTAAAVAARVTGSTVFWGRYTNWLLLLLLLLLLRGYTAGTVTGRVSLLLVGIVVERVVEGGGRGEAVEAGQEAVLLAGRGWLGGRWGGR